MFPREWSASPRCFLLLVAQAGALGALNTLVPTVDASRLWTGVDANGLRLSHWVGVDSF